MLVRLLRSFLRPYVKVLAAVAVLQLLQTLATLLLPSLNADIIDNGIATGDTAYIWRVGLLMLAVTLVQITFAVGAVYYGSRASMGFGRDVRAGLFHRVTGFSTREVNEFGAPSLITRITNDVQQVQMLLFMTCTLLDRCAGHGHRWRHPGRQGGRRTVLAAAREHPGPAHRHRLGDLPDDPAVPAHAGPHRPREPGAAGADHRHAGGAGLRPGAGGDRPVRRGQRRADHDVAVRRAADGPDVPDRHDRPQRVERRRHLAGGQPHQLRRPVGRRADRLPELPRPDPARGDDGHLHGRAGPSGHGVRRADPGGARHRVVGDRARRARDRAAVPRAWSSSATPASPTRAPTSRC